MLIRMDAVPWKEVDVPDQLHDGDLYATHEAVLDIGGFKFRCYRLNNGQAVIQSEDLDIFGFIGG